MAVVGSVQAIVNFTQYPTYQRTTRRYTNDRPFPSVTVCSTRAATHLSFKQFGSKVTEIFYRLVNLCTKHMAEVDELDQYYNSFSFMYENEADYFVSETSFQDIILHCKYMGKACDQENFTETLNPFYGKCFTFNDEKRGHRKKAGERNGLILVLFTNKLSEQVNQQRLYSSFEDGNGAGFKVVVHGSNELVEPQTHAVRICPGFSTSIAFQTTKKTRKKAPFKSSCTDQQMIGDDNKTRYSREGCLAYCKQDKIVEACGCRTSELPSEKHLAEPLCSNVTALERCTIKILNERRECVEQTLDKMLNEDYSMCYCPERCTEYQYTSSQSISYWPVPTVQQSFYNDFIRTQPNSTAYKVLSNYSLQNLVEKDLIRKSFAEVRIYFPNEEVTEIDEIAQYSNYATLLSEIGGSLGFWCGISVLTITELFFFALQKIHARLPQNSTGNMQQSREIKVNPR